MTRVRPQMEKFYYNSTKYDSYLDQLGVKYPSGEMTTPPQAKGKSNSSLTN